MRGSTRDDFVNAAVFREKKTSLLLFFRLVFFWLDSLKVFELTKTLTGTLKIRGRLQDVYSINQSCVMFLTAVLPHDSTYFDFNRGVPRSFRPSGHCQKRLLSLSSISPEMTSSTGDDLMEYRLPLCFYCVLLYLSLNQVIKEAAKMLIITLQSRDLSPRALDNFQVQK